MDLYVMRHGQAGRRDAGRFPDDDLRPLTGKGKRRVVQQAKGLNALNLSLDVIISSPLTRALQTAELVHRHLLSPGSLVVSDALRPTGRPADLVEEIATERASAASAMIVGHEPYLSGLISALVAGDAAPLIRMRKGAVCKLRLASPRYARCGWIEWSLTASQMVKFA